MLWMEEAGEEEREDGWEGDGGVRKGRRRSSGCWVGGREEGEIGEGGGRRRGLVDMLALVRGLWWWW